MIRITVLLADDNKVVRREFKKILELEDDLEVVGEAKNGHEAVAMVKKLRPTLVLMDVSMPLLNGLQATCQILKAVSSTKVLMLSAHSDEAYVVEAVNSGAMGYLIKQTSSGNVCAAIREVHKGNTFFSPSIPKRLHKKPPFWDALRLEVVPSRGYRGRAKDLQGRKRHKSSAETRSKPYARV
jgi:DNA-binding NarL/FixJ family response regulator